MSTVTILVTRLRDSGNLPGVGEARPEHQQRRNGGGGPPQRGGGSDRGGCTLGTPGVWTAPCWERERPESTRTKLPPPRQQTGCAQLQGEQPPAAAHSPDPSAPAPPTPLAPSAFSRPPAAPREGAVTPNEGAAPGTKSRSPPRRRLAPAPP